MMRIREEDSLEAYYFLQYEQQRGMEYMLYSEVNGRVNVAGMFCFAGKEAADVFCKQYPSFTDGFKGVSIGFVLDMMEEVMLVQDQLRPASINTKLFVESKLNHMNNDNAEYLHSQMKYAGFGEGLQGALVKELKNDPGEFNLKYSHTFGKDNVDAQLNFKKSKESDLYFFNSYEVNVKREGKPDISNTFYINQGQSITLKEAYNLLEGRSVEKELLRKLSPEEKQQFKEEMKLPREERFAPERWDKPPHYMAWVKLDLNHKDEHGNFIQKQFHEKFGFDLKDHVEKLPLRKMNASEMGDLMSSLSKGNLTPATFTVDDTSKKFLLAADPQWKGILVYNTDKTLAKKETYSQHTVKEEGQEQKAVGKEQTNGKETAAPWEGKNVEGKPVEQKKTDVGKGVEKDVTKADLLKKGKEDNDLLPKKEKGKQKEGKSMKVA